MKQVPKACATAAKARDAAVIHGRFGHIAMSTLGTMSRYFTVSNLPSSEIFTAALTSCSVWWGMPGGWPKG
jgi:hypothetical protein